MTNTEKIREACIKANPEIVELKFGCEFKYRGGDEIYTATGKENEYGMVPAIDETLLPVKYITKIIGRKITLQDVLLAIEKFAYREVKDVKFRHTKLGEVRTWEDDYKKILEMWNLKEPMENQPEPTKAFIVELV